MFNKVVKDSTVRDIKMASNELYDDLHDAAGNATNKVRGLYNSASSEISHASDKVTGEIRSNPIRSSAMALGIGFILGALLSK